MDGCSLAQVAGRTLVPARGSHGGNCLVEAPRLDQEVDVAGDPRFPKPVPLQRGPFDQERPDSVSPCQLLAPGMTKFDGLCHLQLVGRVGDSVNGKPNGGSARGSTGPHDFLDRDLRC